MKKKPSFYDGVLCSLAILAGYDMPTIAKEIAWAVGEDELIAAAVDEYDKEILRRCGIMDQWGPET